MSSADVGVFLVGHLIPRLLITFLGQPSSAEAFLYCLVKLFLELFIPPVALWHHDVTVPELVSGETGQRVNVKRVQPGGVRRVGGIVLEVTFEVVIASVEALGVFSGPAAGAGVIPAAVVQLVAQVRLRLRSRVGEAVGAGRR